MAGGIRKKSGFGPDMPFINYNESEKHYHDCGGELVGPDPNFKSCQGCGQQGIPVYEAKSESQLERFAEPSDNPFDSDGHIIGLDNKRPRTRYERERQRFLDKRDEISQIDKDVANEMRKGNKVTIIEDSSGELDLGEID